MGLKMDAVLENCTRRNIHKIIIITNIPVKFVSLWNFVIDYILF